MALASFEREAACDHTGGPSSDQLCDVLAGASSEIQQGQGHYRRGGRNADQPHADQQPGQATMTLGAMTFRAVKHARPAPGKEPAPGAFAARHCLYRSAESAAADAAGKCRFEVLHLPAVAALELDHLTASRGNKSPAP